MRSPKARPCTVNLPGHEPQEHLLPQRRTILPGRLGRVAVTSRMEHELGSIGVAHQRDGTGLLGPDPGKAKDPAVESNLPMEIRDLEVDANDFGF